MLPVIRATGSNGNSEGFFEQIDEGTISCGITESNMETFDLHFVFNWHRNGVAFKGYAETSAHPSSKVKGVFIFMAVSSVSHVQFTSSSVSEVAVFEPELRNPDAIPRL